MGAVLCLLASLLQPIVYLGFPAMHHISTYTAASAPSQYFMHCSDGLQMLLIALGLLSPLVGIFASARLLITPESLSEKQIIGFVHVSFAAGLIPYLYVVFFALLHNDTFVYPADGAFFAYIILTVFEILGGVRLLRTKGASPVASVEGDITGETKPQPEDEIIIPPDDVTTGFSPYWMKLVRMNTQEKFRVEYYRPTLLGQDAACDIAVSGNPHVDAKHAKISFMNDTFYLTDLQSEGKTYLNDSCLVPGKLYPLKEDDYITLGDEIFHVDAILKVPEIGDSYPHDPSGPSLPVYGAPPV